MSVRFYFDYISPFAYLGWHRILEAQARRGFELEPIPILFAGLLNHHGTKGPAEVPAKRVYIFQDAVRKASVIGVPIRPPPAHPFNPLLALRVTGLDMPNEVRTELITRLYAATWSQGIGITDPEVVARIADEAGVPDALVRAGAPEAKERLREGTNEAIAVGVFGVPTMICQGQMFWGVDSIEHLERLLDGHDPVSEANLRQWADLPSGAER